jgi:hypothetical protein
LAFFVELGAHEGVEPEPPPTNRRKSPTSGGRQAATRPPRSMAWTAETQAGDPLLRHHSLFRIVHWDTDRQFSKRSHPLLREVRESALSLPPPHPPHKYLDG